MVKEQLWKGCVSIVPSGLCLRLWALQKLRSPLFLVTAQLLLIKRLAVVTECECERTESASLLTPPFPSLDLSSFTPDAAP